MRHPESLSRLGRHTTSRVCLYVKRLSAITLSVLEQMLQQSYEYLSSRDG